MPTDFFPCGDYFVLPTLKNLSLYSVNKDNSPVIGYWDNGWGVYKEEESVVPNLKNLK